MKTGIPLSRMIGLTYVFFWTLLGENALAQAVPDEKLDSRQAVPHAEELLNLGNSVLRLQAYIWRDFMPMALPEDPVEAKAAVARARGMIASIKLVDINGNSLPPKIHAISVWIVQGDRVWRTNSIEERCDDADQSTCDVIVRKGPQWRPRTYVDLVVQFKGEYGKGFLIALRHQIIKATE
jgi:hypothetical protein